MECPSHKGTVLEPITEEVKCSACGGVQVVVVGHRCVACGDMYNVGGVTV